MNTEERDEGRETGDEERGIEKWMPLGFWKPPALKVINLLMVAMLLWNHAVLRRAIGTPPLGSGLKIALVVVTVAGVGFSFWLSRFKTQSGALQAMSEVAAVGPSFTGWESDGPILQHGITHPSHDGIMLVCSGRTAESALTHFVGRAGLASLDPIDRALPKRLPLTREWELASNGFAYEFGTEDRAWIGRLKEHPKVVCQIWWRPADERFTLELFGKVGP